MKSLREVEDLIKATTEGTCWTESGICQKCTDLPLCNSVRMLSETVIELAKVVARNLIAWDTSKDKTQGLLPEVYLTNMRIYKQLTGNEYSFSDACERFNLGD